MLRAIPFALRLPCARAPPENTFVPGYGRDRSTLVKIPSCSRREDELPGTSPGCATAPFRGIVPVGVLFLRLFVHVGSSFRSHPPASRAESLKLPAAKSSLMVEVEPA